LGFFDRIGAERRKTAGSSPKGELKRFNQMNSKGFLQDDRICMSKRTGNA
jgi:hypothetical protein